MTRIITIIAALALFAACADNQKPEAPVKQEKPEPVPESGPETPPTAVPEPTVTETPELEEAAEKAPPEQDAPNEVVDNRKKEDRKEELKQRVSAKSAISVLGSRDGIAGDTGGTAAAALGSVSGVRAGAGGVGGAGLAKDSKKKSRGSRTRGLIADRQPARVDRFAEAGEDHGTEEYAKIDENPFKKAVDNPLSTFSIDVDTASYSNVRRFLRDGKLPPKDAVRIEELVNYFTYEYQGPTGDTPFSVTTELATCPWAPKHHVLMVGLQGRKIDTADMPKSNLVFLMDVSGSMNRGAKLPLLKKAFRLLVDNLRTEDRVAIVVYAGAAGVVLPSTPGTHKPQILEAIERLRAGGSTAGGAGIKLAYQIAKDNFIEGGNNRVILATDGVFNVGVSSTGALTRMIEEKRKDGIFLTVLGFGRGNTKDSRMEALADKGNGNYAYIDSVQEAKKVLVTEMGGTLLAIAKDVKIQVEFNPAKVAEYRLIGYENRLLAKEDFADDTKDAGELGAGHTVTALYEVIPVSTVGGPSGPNDLKYSETKVKDSAKDSPELCTVKLRWKKPDGDKSTLETFAVLDQVRKIADASGDVRWAASVALFGMALRGSELAAGAGYPLALEMAEGAVGWDPGGYRTEFLELAKTAKTLAANK